MLQCVLLCEESGFLQRALPPPLGDPLHEVVVGELLQVQSVAAPRRRGTDRTESDRSETDERS